MVMEARDRTTNLACFAAAAIVWVLVGIVVTTRDPTVDPTAGFVGAALMGLAVTLTLIPLVWLTTSGVTAGSPTAATGCGRSGAPRGSASSSPSW